MNARALSYYIEAQSVMADIEAMKAENLDRNIKGQSTAYQEAQFEAQAVRLRNIHQSLVFDMQSGVAE